MPPRGKVVLAVHGGAGNIRRLPPDEEARYRDALRRAMVAGYSALRKDDGGGGSPSSAPDAAEAAVRSLEDCDLFNAGRGSVLSHDGTVRMDASVAVCPTGGGSDGRRAGRVPIADAGSVAGITAARNPISLARAVMERSPHVMLIGEGAEEFGRGLPPEARVEFAEDAGYFVTEGRAEQLRRAQSAEEGTAVRLDHDGNGSGTGDRDDKFGTVGCVAVSSSHIAAATSTGGMTNQRWGRVGDSPVIGAGTYSSHLCGVCCTGHGEWFLRCAAASDVARRLEYRHGYGDGVGPSDGSSLQKAVEEVIIGTLGGGKEGGGDGGAIAIDRDGNMVAVMNCQGMYHGWCYEDGTVETRIYCDEDI